MRTKRSRLPQSQNAIEPINPEDAIERGAPPLAESVIKDFLAVLKMKPNVTHPWSVVPIDSDSSDEENDA